MEALPDIGRVKTPSCSLREQLLIEVRIVDLFEGIPGAKHIRDVACLLADGKWLFTGERVERQKLYGGQSVAVLVVTKRACP